MREYVQYLKEIDKESGRPYSARYIGTLVADFHRNLITGRIFFYPSDCGTRRNLTESCACSMRHHRWPFLWSRLEAGPYR